MFDVKTDAYEPVRRPLDEYYAEVALRTRWNHRQPPNIICGIGTARTGTTASLNLFRGSMFKEFSETPRRIPVAYQHFKAGFRHAMLEWNENKYWSFQIPNKALFYMKDTIGPYTKTESQFNPLKILDYAKYPLSNVFFVFFFRDPIDSLASWIETWRGVIPRETLVSNFITAAETLVRIKREAEERALAHIHFVYESIRDTAPALAATALFNRINQWLEGAGKAQILFTETSIESWEKLEKEDWSPDQPAIYAIPRAHHGVRTKTRWEYRRRPPKEIQEILSFHELERLNHNGLHGIYEEFRRNTERDLNLRVKPSNSIEKVMEAD
jgi:hypothetical protein